MIKNINYAYNPKLLTTSRTSPRILLKRKVLMPERSTASEYYGEASTHGKGGVMVNLKVRVYINELPQDDEYQKTEYPDVSQAPQVIIVGAGPVVFSVPFT